MIFLSIRNFRPLVLQQFFSAKAAEPEALSFYIFLSEEVYFWAFTIIKKLRLVQPVTACFSVHFKVFLNSFPIMETMPLLNLGVSYSLKAASRKIGYGSAKLKLSNSISSCCCHTNIRLRGNWLVAFTLDWNRFPLPFDMSTFPSFVCSQSAHTTTQNSVEVNL